VNFRPNSHFKLSFIKLLISDILINALSIFRTWPLLLSLYNLKSMIVDGFSKNTFLLVGTQYFVNLKSEKSVFKTGTQSELNDFSTSNNFGII
jgi:hypothetical protein